MSHIVFDIKWTLAMFWKKISRGVSDSVVIRKM